MGSAGRGEDRRCCISNFLIWPLVAFILSALFDLLHYAYASVAWGIFHRIKEKELDHDISKTFLAPRAINWPTLTFFFLKTVLTVAGFATLIWYIAQSLLPGT
jgi:hypothetical protein